MKVQIKASPIGPLAILEGLPASRLSVLEGLNGIGKSLAVRLLEICTGVMPYRLEPDAWKSLCAGLGPFEVVASPAKDMDIRWTGDTRKWPFDSAEDPQSDWFDQISVAGRDANLDEVRALLTVHRIAGDVGLVETLATQTELFAETVRRWTRRTMSGDEAPLPKLDLAFSDVLDQLGSVNPDGYQNLQSKLRAQQHVLTGATKTLAAELDKRHQLVDALQLAGRLSALEKRLPGLERQAQQIDEEIAEVEKRKRELNERFTRAVASTAMDAPKRRELTNARATLARNDKRLSDSLKLAASYGTRLGVPARRSDAQAALSTIDLEMEQLRRHQVEMDAAPTMRRVLDEVSGSLSEAETRGLTDQVAFEDPSSRSKLSVKQMRTGVVNRRVQLEGEPPPPEAAELARRIAEATNRRSEIVALIDLLDDVDRYRRLTKSNEERVERALASLSNVSDADLRVIESQVRKEEERLIELAALRAEVREHLGGSNEATLPALRAQTALVEAELGIDRSRFEVALEEKRSEVAQAENEIAIARGAVAETQRELASADSSIHRAWAFLTQSKKATWLREAIPTGYSSEASSSVQLSVVFQARNLVEQALERLGRHRDQVIAIERALTAIGRHFRKQALGAEEYVPELQTWLGRRFEDWFNQETLRRELFGEPDGRISVDVQSKEVSWKERGAQSIRSRPLEAFSSGEQAFAYTRARLAMLDEGSSGKHRLIALDEFGAFIAHDRLTQLLRYLKERALAHPDDQVVVILPLRQDYQMESRSAFGGEVERFEELAEQVRRKQYAVRTLL